MLVEWLLLTNKYTQSASYYSVAPKEFLCVDNAFFIQVLIFVFSSIVYYQHGKSQRMSILTISQAHFCTEEFITDKIFKCLCVSIVIRPFYLFTRNIIVLTAGKKKVHRAKLQLESALDVTSSTVDVSDESVGEDDG